jgi:hypothetical protein
MLVHQGFVLIDTRQLDGAGVLASLGLTPLFASSAPMAAGLLALGKGVLVGSMMRQDLLGGARIRRP